MNMEGLSDLGNTQPRTHSVVYHEIEQLLTELQRPAEEHPSRPRSNSVVNAEIEQMIAELRTHDEEHRVRMAEIRHTLPFFEADAGLFRRAGVVGTRGATRLHSMSRNATVQTLGSAPLTPAGKRFMEQLPVADENDFPDETSCGICMDPYGSTDDPESRARLPCGHLMGRTCIERWLKTCNTCPLCRHVLFEQGDDAESPAFLELQELLQGLGQAVTTLFARMMDHVRDYLRHSDPSVETELRQVGLIPDIFPEAAAASIEDVLYSSNPRTSFETDSPRAEMTADDPEEAVPSRGDDVASALTELDEIGHQQAALDARLAQYNSDVADGLQGPERQMEFGQLVADNEELAARLGAFRLRRQEMMARHGLSLSRAE